MSFKINLSKSVDTRPLLASLLNSYDWSEDRAKAAIQQYLNFLCLAWLYPDRLLIPTEAIDRVWHCHILHTRQYRQDCEVLFGCYLDHEPLNLEELPDQSLQSAFEQTKALFERHFGTGSFDHHSNAQPAACSLFLEPPLKLDAPGRYSDPGACGRPNA
nr:MAG: glycine-rich domain-containing protein-like [Leptolyngbya sp. IPPAS B-1204]